MDPLSVTMHRRVVDLQGAEALGPTDVAPVLSSTAVIKWGDMVTSEADFPPVRPEISGKREE